MIEVVLISHDDAPERLVAAWAEAERLGLKLRRRSSCAATGEADGEARAADLRAACADVEAADLPFAAILRDDATLDESLLPFLDAAALARAMAPKAALRLDGPWRDDGDDRPRIVPIARAVAGFEALIVSREAARVLAGAGEGAADPTDAVRRGAARGIELAAALPPPVGTQDETEAPRPSLIGRLGEAVRGLRGPTSGRPFYLAVPSPSGPDASEDSPPAKPSISA